MKKLLLAFIACSFLLVACGDADKKSDIAKNSDWYSTNLKGAVQSIESTTYTPDSTGAIGEMDSCCIETEQFDNKGYTTSTSKKDSKGVLKEEMTLTRHDKGQAKDISNMKDGNKTGGMSIQVDDKGKYSGAQELDSAGKVLFYYTDLGEDDNGAVTAGKRYKADSTFMGIFNSEYKNGIQVSNKFSDSTGKEVFYSKSELNDKGDIAKTTTMTTDKDSTTTKVTTFTYDSYDETGNWTQRTTYDDKGKVTKVTKRTIIYHKKE